MQDWFVEVPCVLSQPTVIDPLSLHISLTKSPTSYYMSDGVAEMLRLVLLKDCNTSDNLNGHGMFDCDIAMTYYHLSSI